MVRIALLFSSEPLSGPIPEISSTSVSLYNMGVRILMSGMNGPGSGPGRHPYGAGGHMIRGDGGHRIYGDGGHVKDGAGGHIICGEGGHR